MADRTARIPRPRRSRSPRLAATARGALRRLFRLDGAEPPPVLAEGGTAVGALFAAARSTVARRRLARAEAGVEAARSALAYETSVWDALPDLVDELPADPLFRARARQATILNRAERRLDAALRELDAAGAFAARATAELPAFPFGRLAGGEAPPALGGDSERRKAKRLEQRSRDAAAAQRRLYPWSELRSGRFSAFKATGRASVSSSLVRELGLEQVCEAGAICYVEARE